jgi:hypothetical protein
MIFLAQVLLLLLLMMMRMRMMSRKEMVYGTGLGTKER